MSINRKRVPAQGIKMDDKWFFLISLFSTLVLRVATSLSATWIVFCASILFLLLGMSPFNSEIDKEWYETSLIVIIGIAIAILLLGRVL